MDQFENIQGQGHQETPRNDDPNSDDVIVINRAMFYYVTIAILFFVLGVVTSWIAFTTTTNRVVGDVKSAAASAAQDAVKTAVAALPAGGGNAVAVEPTPVPRQNVSVGNSPAWGPADAKVTIVEFSDFECPFCERFFTQTYPLIRNVYGNKVRFVYRHFPLTSIHPDALPSALAAECANEQGKFWDYHDYLFSHQSDLSHNALVSYATQVQVPDIKQFTTCFDSQKYMSTIQSDLTDGTGYSVSGTPTFFINGNILVGAQPYQVFASAIDHELASVGAS